jgi:hypothetical protein
MKTLIMLTAALTGSLMVQASDFKGFVVDTATPLEVAAVKDAVEKRTNKGGSGEVVVFVADLDPAGRVRVREALTMGRIKDLDDRVIHESKRFKLSVDASVKSLLPDGALVDLTYTFGKHEQSDRKLRGRPLAAEREGSQVLTGSTGGVIIPFRVGYATPLSRVVEIEESALSDGKHILKDLFMIVAYVYP